MTKIDAASAITKPLQCTDIFYDSKKSIMNTKECRKLNLCYNRKRGYLGPFLVQHDARDGFGMLKVKYLQRRWTFKMFYKQFLEITDGLNADVVKEFDFWLATLPEKEAKSITISTVASRLGIQYSIADLLLDLHYGRVY